MNNSMFRFYGGRGQEGFTLIEILITLVITAFGLLGLAGFITKSTTLTADASQRARASVLLSDMAGRISNNKSNADSYAIGGELYGENAKNCPAEGGQAAIDLCEWNNLLYGTNDAQAGGNSAFLGFRGCITKTSIAPAAYAITLAWGSMTAGVPPADDCGAGAFGDESLRRVIRTQVRVATLSK